jgi:hypothetical protein
VKRLTAALAKAEHERNLATVEAIGHAHSDGHLSSLVDEQREEIERLTKERDNWRRSADAAMNSLRYWEGIKERAEKAEARATEAEREVERLRAQLAKERERITDIALEAHGTGQTSGFAAGFCAGRDAAAGVVEDMDDVPTRKEASRLIRALTPPAAPKEEPPPCRECASMVVGGRCLSCGAEHTEET